MAKTQDELNKLKSEYKRVATKLSELSDEELTFVIGGFHNPIHCGGGSMIHAPVYEENEGINPTSTKGWFSTAANNQNLKSSPWAETLETGELLANGKHNWEIFIDESKNPNNKIDISEV